MKWLKQSWLDYCNSLYVGMSEANLAKVQRVQNLLARVATSARKHYHITPILNQLHWLAALVASTTNYNGPHTTQQCWRTNLCSSVSQTTYQSCWVNTHWPVNSDHQTARHLLSVFQPADNACSSVMPSAQPLLVSGTVYHHTACLSSSIWHTPSSSIWPYLSYGLVRSNGEYYHNCSLVVLLCSFL